MSGQCLQQRQRRAHDRLAVRQTPTTNQRNVSCCHLLEREYSLERSERGLNGAGFDEIVGVLGARDHFGQRGQRRLDDLLILQIACRAPSKLS